MSRSRFSEEEIIVVLKEAEAGVNIHDLCHKHGISEATFYKWRTKYGGQEANNDRLVRKLEEENRRLRAIVADLTLRNQALKTVMSKKW